MFKELAPLLRQRAILFTVTHVGDEQFRVNIVPRKLSKTENDALTTPVSVTGTVDDLDTQLPGTLAYFVTSHLELKNTLDRAKAEMDAAAKAAQAEAGNKTKAAVVKKETLQTTKSAAKPDAEVVEKPEPPEVRGLFDAAPESEGTTEDASTTERGNEGDCTPAEDHIRGNTPHPDQDVGEDEEA
jgi:PRTRC genetic system protein E